MIDTPCTRCGELRDLKKPCKTCRARSHAKWAEKNKEHLANYKREWNQKNPERHKVNRANYYQNNKDKILAQERLNRYGITEEQRTELLLKQGRACAICGALEPRGHGDWHVDHDHKTGVVRGLLCNGCNLGLGHFKDSVDILRKAISYLEARRS